jgi:hypothetical protein
MMSRRIVLPLKYFLLAVVASGAAIGLSLRHPSYELVDGVCDEFGVEAIWRRSFPKQQELVYLLAFPERGKPAGVSTRDPRGLQMPTMGPTWVIRSPNGVFVNGTRVAPTTNNRFWICFAHEGRVDLQPVDATATEIASWTSCDLRHLQATKLWQERMRPLLVEASVRRCEEYERDHGVYPPSRFPRRENIDWENLSAYFQ